MNTNIYLTIILAFSHFSMDNKVISKVTGLDNNPSDTKINDSNGTKVPAKKEKKVKVKIDRTKLSAEEKEFHRKKYNELLARKRQKMKAEYLATQERRKQEDDSFNKLHTELCKLYSVEHKSIETKEIKSEEPVLDEEEASDFDSSPESESEDEEPDPDDTDSEVDEEERQLFKVIPWDAKKYENLTVYIDTTSVTEKNEFTKIIIPGIDASLSVLIREVMDDHLKHHPDVKIVDLQDKKGYGYKALSTMAYYMKMYNGNQPIYKLERPLKNHTNLMDSCKPIEIRGKRMNEDDAKRQFSKDEAFYKTIIQANANIEALFELSDYYNVVGLKNLFAAIYGASNKKVISEFKDLRSFMESLIAEQVAFYGSDKSKVENLIKEVKEECEAMIKEYEASDEGKKANST